MVGTTLFAEHLVDFEYGINNVVFTHIVLSEIVTIYIVAPVKTSPVL